MSGAGAELLSTVFCSRRVPSYPDPKLLIFRLTGFVFHLPPDSSKYALMRYSLLR
jgi:hypothetical protein